MSIKSIEALQADADHIMSMIKPLGVTQAEVAVSQSTGLSVSVRHGEVDTVEYQKDQSFGVTLYRGKAKGSASTTDTQDASIQATIQAAYEMAAYTAEDPCAGIADEEDLAKEILDLECYRPWSISAEEAVALAVEYEACALGMDKRICNVDGTNVNVGEGVRVYANSHGFSAGNRSSRHDISCILLAKGQSGEMQRDYGYTMSRDPALLASKEVVAEEAVSRTVRRLDGVQPETMEVPVLLDARLAGGLISHYLSAVSGGNQYRQTSFLLDAEGQQIFPEWLSIEENPFLKGGLGSKPFDNEGVAPQQRWLVQQGVCEGYILGSYSARKLKRRTTGNSGGHHNILVSDTGQSTEEMLALMDKGILITDLFGQGVNIVTGDYSRGASGFWVENGQIQYPVEEMTIAGKLQDMFRNVVAIGSEREVRSSIQTGPILLERMTIAGK